MKRLLRLFLPLGLLAACAAPDTLVQPVDASAFATASTFAVEAPDVAGTADRGAAERLRAAVEEEVTRVMSAKGYQPAALGAADLRVTCRLASMGRVAREDREDPQAESRPKMGAGDPYGGYEPLAGTGAGARRGLLLVTITDVKSGAVILQATSEGVATSTSSAAREVARGARTALEKVPDARRVTP